MRTDKKLGQFITSPAFFARAAAVVEEAVSDLEARGLTPTYDKPKGKLVDLDADQVRVVEVRVKRKTFHSA